MGTRIWQTNLFVRDMQASVDFYRLLELEFDDPFEWPEGSGAQHVEIGDSRLGCYMALDNHPMARLWHAGFEPDRGAGNAVVGLLVDTRDDVDRLCELVSAAGHPVAQEPYDAFFGSRYAIVIDPDGNQVGVKSPIEDDQRYVPG